MRTENLRVLYNGGNGILADVNAALAAIVTNNSGAIAPTTTYAYQEWVDTTTGLLKVRDSTNTSWIVMGTIGAAYMGLLSLAGGQMTGVLNESLGASIASASTINLTAATGNGVHITGTTAITAVTLGAGMFRTVIFDGILTLTHHATNNNLQGAANITTAVGDRAIYWGDGTTVYCFGYVRADGTSLTQNTLSRKNLVINGAFDLSQYATSQALTSLYAYNRCGF